MKKITVLLLTFAMILMAKPALAGRETGDRTCLNQGSYLFTKRGSEIFRMEVNGDGLITETVALSIPIPGSSPNEIIAANSCDVFFSWAKPGEKSEIWAINAVTGWELRKITITPGSSESSPVLNGWGTRVGYTEDSNIASVYLNGKGHRIEGKGQTPAWQEKGPLTYTLPNGQIYIWGMKGEWHAYRPDRGAILIKNGREFTSHPFSGFASDFAEARSVAYKPSGDLAAFVTLDGNLQIVALDKNWLPNGAVVSGSGLSDLSFVIWIDV